MAFKKQSIIIPFIVIASFCLGGITFISAPKIKSLLSNQVKQGDITGSSKWSNEFKFVEIPSSEDNSLQSAYFFAAVGSDAKKPLLVSLHSWSGTYLQVDPLAEMALKHGWNYIHPDFRGVNRSKNACLSKLVITDIDDAIQYVIDNSNVDTENIFIVGVSGGGYATLGAYLKTRHKIKVFFSWVPISDLSAWYYQSINQSIKVQNMPKIFLGVHLMARRLMKNRQKNALQFFGKFQRILTVN